ncbi:MAG: response regulator [Halobaculum sp.]
MAPTIDPAADIRALVVDDEKEVADAYALRLREVCDTTTAYTGEAALDTVGSAEIDVVLLDRHMPGMSGDEVLERLRDREFGGRVIMVTAVDPGFKVIDMPFDDYLCKPVEREDLHAAIEHQRRVLAYETLGEYFRAESKRSVLAAEVPPEERADRPEYTELDDRVSQLRARAERLLGEDRDPFDAFGRIGREEL